MICGKCLLLKPYCSARSSLPWFVENTAPELLLICCKCRRMICWKFLLLNLLICGRYLPLNLFDLWEIPTPELHWTVELYWSVGSIYPWTLWYVGSNVLPHLMILYLHLNLKIYWKYSTYPWPLLICGKYLPLNLVGLCERHLGQIVGVGSNLKLASLNKYNFTTGNLQSFSWKFIHLIFYKWIFLNTLFALFRNWTSLEFAFVPIVLF